MSDATLSSEFDSTSLPSLPPGCFHPLLDNKFEAAFSAGRLINWINHMEALRSAFGDPLSIKEVTTFILDLTACCNKLELSHEERYALSPFITRLGDSLMPWLKEGDDLVASSIDEWLRYSRDPSFPTLIQTRFQLNLNDPLIDFQKKLIDVKGLSAWVILGLELDRVFRAVDLDNRIQKESVVSTDRSPIEDQTDEAKEAAVPKPQHEESPDVWELKLYPGWQLRNLVYRNQSINTAFSQYVSLKDLIPTDFEQPDEICEVIIANAVRRHAGSLVNEARKMESDNFLPLRVECSLDGAFVRNGQSIKLGSNELLLTKILLREKCPLTDGKRSLQLESIVSNKSLVETLKFTDNHEKLNKAACRANESLILIALQIVCLKNKTGSKGNGRTIVDLMNNEDRSYADKWKCQSSIEVHTMQDVAKAIEKSAQPKKASK